MRKNLKFLGAGLLIAALSLTLYVSCATEEEDNSNWQGRNIDYELQGAWGFYGQEEGPERQDPLFVITANQITYLSVPYKASMRNMWDLRNVNDELGPAPFIVYEIEARAHSDAKNAGRFFAILFKNSDVIPEWQGTALQQFNRTDNLIILPQGRQTRAPYFLPPVTGRPNDSNREMYDFFTGCLRTFEVLTAEGATAVNTHASRPAAPVVTTPAVAGDIAWRVGGFQPADPTDTTTLRWPNTPGAARVATNRVLFSECPCDSTRTIVGLHPLDPAAANADPNRDLIDILPVPDGSGGFDAPVLEAILPLVELCGAIPDPNEGQRVQGWLVSRSGVNGIASAWNGLLVPNEFCALTMRITERGRVPGNRNETFPWLRARWNEAQLAAIFNFSNTTNSNTRQGNCS